MVETFSVDVENDWGGRYNSIRGIELGIPRILDLFEEHNIKGIFFLSTKKLVRYCSKSHSVSF